MHKIVNGKKVNLTQEEVEARQAEELSNQPSKEDLRKKLKFQLERDMALTTVELNGKIFWADPDSEQNFSGRIREMELNGRTETKWAQGSDVFLVTLDELKIVVAEGTKKNASLWDAYIEAIEAL